MSSSVMTHFFPQNIFNLRLVRAVDVELVDTEMLVFYISFFLTLNLCDLWYILHL
jgi:metal-sulfur cluster biosynthetic enzyme